MMKKLHYLLLISCCLALFSNQALAQMHGIYPGISITETTDFSFMPPDSLSHNTTYMGTVFIDTSVTDTTETRLWQIGNTNKAYFADSGATMGIMTDTLNTYPVNANSWFTLHFSGNWLNPIVGFTHKYQTTAGLDGGIVEFSLDSGMTWQNIKGDCNVDSPFTFFPGVLTTNCYAKTDTLFNGEMGFSGSSNGWETSWFQFFTAIPARTTNGTCDFHTSTGIQVRFRFISDSSAESLDGWLIGNVEVRDDFYGWSVAKVNKNMSLAVYPNPSADGIFTFPAMENEQAYRIEIVNTIGQTVMSAPYTRKINLAGYARGLYFYIVTNGSETYKGQLISN